MALLVVIGGDQNNVVGVAIFLGRRAFATQGLGKIAPVGVRLRLGMGRCAPSESTIRRILGAVDAQVLAPWCLAG